MSIHSRFILRPADGGRDASPAAPQARHRALAGDRLEGVGQALRGLRGSAGEVGRRLLEFILSALRAHDADTYRHSLRTSRLCALLGRSCGLTTPQLRVLKWAALLHDIGKVCVPREILRAPGALTHEEWAAMRRHPGDGQSLLQGIPDFAEVARVVFQHHESWNGSGYPQGLCGEAIEFNARVVAVADAFDSMVNGRPYRPALTCGAAFAELSRCAGTQFDPLIVGAFERVPLQQIATHVQGGAHREATPAWGDLLDAGGVTDGLTDRRG